MELTPNVITAVAVIFGVLLILLIGVLVSFIVVIKRGLDESLKKTRVPDVDSDKLMSGASTRSVKVLEDAHKRAREIIGDAEAFLERDENKLKESVDRTTQVYVQKYESSLNNIQLEAAKVLEAIPRDINASFSRSLGEFEKMLKEEVKNVEKNLGDSISESLKGSEEEIKKYKEARMRELDESLIGVVKEISKRVLGKDLSTVEHEKLVIKALEEAKRQGLFNV